MLFRSKQAFARVAARVVRIHAVAAERAVISGHGRGETGHPVGEFRQGGLGDDHRPGFAQVLHKRCLIRRHETVESQSAARGRHVRGVNVVFHRDGNTVERPANLTLRPLAVPRIGFLKRVPVHRDRRMQLVFVQRDPRKQSTNLKTSLNDALRDHQIAV